MTEQNHHDPAELDKLAEKFTVLPNDNPASDAKRAELIDKPAFGQVFSDNMAHMTWTKGEGWSDRRIEPYAPLKMDPGASVLHYAQECFEGLKAYRHADGSTWLFRPDANAERFQNSAKRLYLPELPIDDFIGSVAALVKRDVNWVPSRREYTLYMRPFMFASEPFLGVRAPQEVDYCVIASPSGPYFPGGVKPVSIWVEDKWFRTGPGGTGFAKCGGNYAASLLGEYTGIDHGCEQVCFVDAATKTYLEELGGMNMMVVHKDGHVETPSLTGNILPGVTRRSLIQLIQDNGHDVVETMIALDQLLEDIKSGEVTEVFACGTAAIITPIGRFKSEKFDVTVADGGSGEFTLALRNQLLGFLGLPEHHAEHYNDKNNEKKDIQNKLLGVRVSTGTHYSRCEVYDILLTSYADSSGVIPRCSHALRVATRPFGVRMRKPSRTRYGSHTVSTVSDSSPTMAARLFKPTGPPLKLVTMALSTAISRRSRPSVSI